METLKLIPKEEKMKRFWLVMLSLGLVLAFSASAMAVDVKFSGSYYAAGMYLDKTSLRNTNDGSDNVSTAFYYQRLRVQTDFIVSPGLKLVTRFDAMERVWGAARTTPATATSATTAGGGDSKGTTAESENIAFDVAYVQWQSPIGFVMVGYIPDGKWGTVFGDNDSSIAKIQFVTQVGPVMMSLYTAKSEDNSSTAKVASTRTDLDYDKYVATITYTVNKDIAVGLLGLFYNSKQYKQSGAVGLSTYAPTFSDAAASSKIYGLNPYAKAKFGPVAVEAEALYVFGKSSYEDTAISRDVTLGMLNAYASATVDLGMFYFGGTVAYLSGDDPSTTDKWEGGQVGGGWDWNPTLILFNHDRTWWAGPLKGYNSAYAGAQSGGDSQSGLFGAAGMVNAWFGQGVIGVRPIPALDINASLSYAAADQKPAAIVGFTTSDPRYLNAAYGWEVDITGTYKITNNLSYMLGVGYLFTGDYFKGTSNDNSVRNDYLLINKLTLTF